LLKGEAGGAVTHKFLLELDHVLIKHAVQEGFPFWRRGIKAGVFYGGAFAEPVGWFARSEFAGFEVDDTVGAGEQQRVLVEFVSGYGKRVVDNVGPFDAVVCTTDAVKFIDAADELFSGAREGGQFYGELGFFGLKFR